MASRCKAAHVRPRVLLLLLASAGCNGESAAKTEAHDLLQRIQAIEDDTSLEARKKALDALVLLRLESSDNRKARDACHAAHAGLLAAETEQAIAKKALDEAQKGPSGAPLSAQSGKLVADAIERSNRALAAAQKHFPSCETAMQGLIARAR